MVEEKSDLLKLEGSVIAGPEKMKIRHACSGVDEVTLSKGVLNALRVKVKQHRFLNISVILDKHGRRVIVAETSEE